MSGIFAYFKAAPATPSHGPLNEKKFRLLRGRTFLAMTAAYVMFYVCRLSFTVAKSALVDIGITPSELGMIGSALFFCYAIGKLVNGFLADHANVVRFMSLGLLLSAGMNVMMGMTTNALLLTLFWGHQRLGRSRWASARAPSHWRAGTAARSAAPSTASGPRRITSAKR
ncbi:Regulatory protein uhpC [Serratia rubidaea]|uniref:Regulatory protein uhpC n=1 Tax=Serratia rubidaea TaxID=61652 RepID=A0A4U9HWE5_SERRU|nr:Regulatory protein uhpC [Serratia rubidaea]